MEHPVAPDSRTSEPRLSRRTLPRSFYLRPTLEVARDLIGRVLVHRLDGARLAGRILEVEAYQGPDDLAAHSSRGRTRRTEPMYWRGGHAYVYFIYGMHHCFNVVVGPEGTPHAILVRALEPIEGIERMMENSPRSGRRDLCRGPGRLARALALTREQDRTDLVQGPVRIEAGAAAPRRVVGTGRRVGVDYAGTWAGKAWRFGWRGHSGLSRPL